jgi:DNA repair protein RadC
LEPSGEDCEVTQRLRQSGSLLGIPLLDHIIFCDEGYFSFLEEGKLQ